MTTEREVTTIYRDLTDEEAEKFQRDTSETMWMVAGNDWVQGAHPILGWAGSKPVIWESGLSTYDARCRSLWVSLVANEEEARANLRAVRDARRA